jgi:hypothetical protein
LTGDGSVCFIADGEDNIRILDSFSKTAALSGSIRYYPPLEKDSSGAIEVLAGEVNYCLYKLGVFRDRYAQPLSVDEAVTLTAKLLAREDIGGGERLVLEKMHAGFETYALWEGGKAKRGAAASALESAAESCSKYLAGAGDEE